METQENRKEMVNPICFIMIGLPGSGKSTVAESYSKKFNADILSTDDFIEYQAEWFGLTYNEAFSQFYQDAEKAFKSNIANALKDKKNVIIDRTNLTPKRVKFVKRFIEAGFQVIYVLVERRDDVLDKVNEERKKTGRHLSDEVRNRLKESYVPPTIDEGVHKIVYVGGIE